MAEIIKPPYFESAVNTGEVRLLEYLEAYRTIIISFLMWRLLLQIHVTAEHNIGNMT